MTLENDNALEFYASELRKIAEREFPDKEVKGYGMGRVATRLILEEVADIINALDQIGPIDQSWGTDKQFNDGWNECRRLMKELFENGGRE